MSERATLLFGADPTPGLVAFALAADGRGIRVWRRDGEQTLVDVVPFTPFLLLTDAALVADATGLVGVQAPDGAGELRWRARFGSWSEALGARDLCRQRSGLAPDLPVAPYR